jgi:beta-galactosidase/beta-glucuronidase
MVARRPALVAVACAFATRQRRKTARHAAKRFGFKEFWTQGPDFYLNGVKRHLLGSGTWPSWNPESRAGIRERIQHLKDTHVNVFRLHIGPWIEAWHELADEMGMMLIEESPALHRRRRDVCLYRRAVLDELP